ncbi:hypothetical protein QT970_21920 [Microcoleus sp. herbarium8]|uniref:hypothetical protein n=1 Tax=Microcoleus sp. herbarium8 TaxID=3055436 RepID=UPI002FD1753D
MAGLPRPRLTGQFKTVRTIDIKSILELFDRPKYFPAKSREKIQDFLHEYFVRSHFLPEF